MRLTDFLTNPIPQKSSASSVLGKILPADPTAPEKPTIPPPTCGTLPPGDLLGDVLGKLGKPGR